MDDKGYIYVRILCIYSDCLLHIIAEKPVHLHVLPCILYNAGVKLSMAKYSGILKCHHLCMAEPYDQKTNCGTFIKDSN